MSAIVTPFDAQGRIDEAGFRANVELCIGYGATGLVVNGCTGEFWAQYYEAPPLIAFFSPQLSAMGNKVDFELFCLAVSAINGCEVCLQSHEKTVVDGGLSQDAVIDAIRIAAVVHAVACALETA
jgi:AhpD family alkylhydroperoxidase